MTLYSVKDVSMTEQKPWAVVEIDPKYPPTIARTIVSLHDTKDEALEAMMQTIDKG